MHLEQCGYFPKIGNENWFVAFISAQGNEPEYITGESDSFQVDIYKNVILIGCIERFSVLYDTERNLSDQFFKIITEMAQELTNSHNVLIGAGGMQIGLTDQIIDMAYYEQADFDQICHKMHDLNGIPARNLIDLKDKSWYLG